MYMHEFKIESQEVGEMAGHDIHVNKERSTKQTLKLAMR